MKKNESEKGVENNVEKLDENVISSEVVAEVINGDEVALAEQMERTKALTKEQQIKAMKNAEIIKAKQKAEEEAKKQEEKRIQEEAKKRIEAEKQAEEAKKLAAQKQAEEAKRLAQQKQEEARKLAEQKAQEEAKKIAQQKQAEEAKKLAAQKQEQEKISAAQNQNSEIKQDNQNQPPVKNDGPSTFKRVMAVFLFIALFAIVYFLPEISDAINKFKESRKPKEVITDGVSTCKLSRTSENLDITTIAKFSIINSKLYKLEYVTTTTGDKIEDEEELKKINDECSLLKEYAGELDGVSITCSLNNGTNTTKQKLDFEKLDLKKVTTAYTEAGGVYPEFKKNDNIDKIESKMKSSGYECTRS